MKTTRRTPRCATRLDDSVRIPGQARDLAGFRAWAVSPRFPERGRIDFLAGDLEVDMSPEDLQTHSLVKTEIAAVLQLLVTRQGLGEVYVDRARISSPAADLSVEPDVVVVLWETLDSGRLRDVPAASGKPGRYIEMEGAPDLVVEILSDSSVRKDLIRLPPLYAAAGVPELWQVDARQERLRFEILALETGAATKESNRTRRGGRGRPGSAAGSAWRASRRAPAAGATGWSTIERGTHPFRLLATGEEGRFRVEIPAASPLFAGHFPGHPILPGIAHLAIVERALGIPLAAVRSVQDPPAGGAGGDAGALPRLSR